MPSWVHAGCSCGGGWSWCWSIDKSLVKALIVAMLISYSTDFFVNNFKLHFNIKWDTILSYISVFLLSYHPYQRHSLHQKHRKPLSSPLSEYGSKWFPQTEQVWGNKGSHTGSWETRALRADQLQSNTHAWILAALGRLKNSSLPAYLFRDIVSEMESLWRALSTLRDH